MDYLNLQPAHLWVLAGAVPIVVAVVFVLRALVMRPREARRQDAEERRLRAQVAAKAALGGVADGVQSEENLTDSGIFSVLEMMDALVGSGNFDEAEKWALNAISNHPNRTDVPLKLAEIYYRAGRKSAFLAVVANLTRKGLDVPAPAREKLARMASELAPGEAVLAALGGEGGAAATRP